MVFQRAVSHRLIVQQTHVNRPDLNKAWQMWRDNNHEGNMVSRKVDESPRSAWLISWKESVGQEPTDPHSYWTPEDRQTHLWEMEINNFTLRLAMRQYRRQYSDSGPDTELMYSY